jgi:N6-L-threonylcarbamoyladenine synthase
VKNNFVMLGIETSCDETAASLVLNGTQILSNIISSQIDVHRAYGGVVPEIASRKHVENIGFVVHEALKAAQVDKKEIDCVAVTAGPGLVGALLVGASYAKALAYALQKPLIAVNHIEGHICANYIDNEHLRPPFICLVVSGGHTHLVRVQEYGVYEILGHTRDDAAGEAYDKTARALGLPYPGGPVLDELAQKGNPNAYPLPRVQVSGNPYDFSFSGLKSAVLNLIQKTDSLVIEDMAASFQKAVVNVLVEKTMRACQASDCSVVALAGGVASNRGLRAAMKKAADENRVTLHIPKPVYCTDNAAMIAVCGYFKWKQGKLSPLTVDVRPELHWDV